MFPQCTKVGCHGHESSFEASSYSSGIASTETSRISTRASPSVGDAGSPNTQVLSTCLSTSQSSPELLMVETGFAACKYQVAVLSIIAPQGADGRKGSSKSIA